MLGYRHATAALVIFIALPASAQPIAGKPPAESNDDKPKESWSSVEEVEDESEPEAAPVADDTLSGDDASPYRAQPMHAPTGPTNAEAPTPSRAAGSSENAAWLAQWTPRFAERSVAVDFDVLSRAQADTYTWDVKVQLGFDDAPVFFDLQLPWTFSTAGSGAGSFDHLQFGNVVVGGHGGAKIADWAALYGGLSVSIASVYESLSLEQAIALGLAASVRAGAEMHRFIPRYVPLRAPFGAELALSTFLHLRLEVAPTLFIPTKEVQDEAERAGADPWVVSMDQIAEVEALSPLGLGGGLRFQNVLVLAGEQSDKAQLAFEPFLSYHPPTEGPYGFPLFARLGLLVALDEPFGFGFDTNKVATVRSTVGVRF